MTLVANYVPTDWVDHVTPVDEAHMDKIDQAIDQHADAINTLDTRLVAEEAMPNIPAVVNGQWLKGSAGAMIYAPIAIADVTSLQSSLDAKQDMTGKGAVNGYAGLDGTGKVPPGQLPVSIDLRWAGTYAAGTGYKEGDVVISNGISYLALRPSTGETPVPWSTAGGGAIPHPGVKLNADVPIPSGSFGDALTLPLTAGTWLVLAQFGAQQSSGGNGTPTFRLWDGTSTVYAVTQSVGVLTSSTYMTGVLAPVVTLGAAGNVVLSGYNTRSGANFKTQNIDQPQGAGTATFINAIKLA